MAEEFDKFASDYREIHTANIGKASGVDSDYFSEYKIKELWERKLVAEGIHWLDLGCGDGNIYRFISRYYSDFKYSGIDVSQSSIEQSEARYGSDEKHSFSVYDGQNIPFEDDTFDCIFIACVMHHIVPEQRDFILKECNRVLKKGGRLIVFEHNPYNPLTLKMVNTCPFDENAVLLKPSELRKRLKEYGFKAKIRYTIFMPRKGIFNKMLPLEKALSWCPIGGQYYWVFEK